MREDSNAGFSRALVKKWWREADVRSSAVCSHPPPAGSRWSFFTCILRTLVLVELVAPRGSGTDLRTSALLITAGSDHSHSDVLRDDVGPKKTDCAQ